MTTLSNTGKTITLFISKDDMTSIEAAFASRGLNLERFRWIYDRGPRRLMLKADPKGRYLSFYENGARCTTVPSDQMPQYPRHGRIDVEISFGSDSIYFNLPKELPAPRPLVRKPKRLVAVREAASGRHLEPVEPAPIQVVEPVTQPAPANVLVTLGGVINETLSFNIPHDELLRIVLRWAHAGHANHGS